MRAFISYHTPDFEAARAISDAVTQIEPSFDPYFAPRSNVAGDYWLPRLGDEIEAADVVLLLLGDRVGTWQEIEYYEAMRLNRDAGKPLIVPVVIGVDVPGLSFIHLFHRILVPRIDEPGIEQIVAALRGRPLSQEATELWRHTNPYRGLKSLTSANAAYFFGRERLTNDLISALNEGRTEILTLVGNSGVGKSSLVLAGLLSALRRKTRPGADVEEWPYMLDDSHRWQMIVIEPGQRPLKRLARTFTRLWIESEAQAEAEANAWADNLRNGSDISDLASVALERLGEAAGGQPPKRLLLYVDQGEELYVRAEPSEAAAFSAHLAAAASDDRLRIVTSIRADYYGRLQADEPLFDKSRRFDVPPLTQGEYEDIVRKPAAALGATFDQPDIVPIIAAAAAREAGALPLISFLMEEAWEEMRDAGDGVLRFSAGLVDIGQPLKERAEAFLKSHPAQEPALRRLLTLRLAHVPKEGEAVRRRARRSDCKADEWALARELAEPDWRLLTFGEEDGEATIEVAHETLLRRWPRLVGWIDEAREFLIWRGQLESDRREWEAAEPEKRPAAVLSGLKLENALSWFATYRRQISRRDGAFIRLSRIHDLRQRREEAEAEARAARTRLWLVYISSAAALIGVAFAGVFIFLYNEAETARSELSETAANLKSTAANLENALHIADERLLRAQVEQARFRSDQAKDYLDRDPSVSVALGASAFEGIKPESWRDIEVEASVVGAIAQARSQPLPEILRGHEDYVKDAAFSPDGAHVVTASDDETARLWSATTGAEITILRGHEGSVYGAAFSPDGTRVVTASDDGTARLWDAASGAEIAVLHGHEKSVLSARFSRDGARVVTASMDRTARLWDAASGAEIAVLRGHGGSVYSAAFSPDGSRVVTASDDGTARLWDAASGAEIIVLREHEYAVLSAAFSPDGARVVTASDDATASLWDAASGVEIAILRGHEKAVLSAAFSPDGARIVTASADTTVRLWDAASGAEIAVLRGHEDFVVRAAFSSDGARVVTASWDSTAGLWDVVSSAEIAVLRGHEYAVVSVAFSLEGARVITASMDRTARIWDAASGAEITILRGHAGDVWSAAFSSDGSRVVTASSDGTARLLDAASGAELAVLRGHQDFVVSAAFSPDSARVVTASEDNTARLWDAATGAQIGVFWGHERDVYSAAFSPDGARVVTASQDTTARIWDAASGEEITVLHGHRGVVYSAAFSPDGARVITSSSDSTARLWDVASGAEIAVLRGHEDRIRSAAFSPDGARIVTASQDTTARLWDAATGTEIAVLRGHEGYVWSAAFSPDGRRVVTASSDGTARLWDAAQTFEGVIEWAIEYAKRNDPMTPDEKCAAYLKTAGCDQ